MQNLIRYAVVITFVLAGTSAYSQESTANPVTSATDHSVRIEKTKRPKTGARAKERQGRSLRKQKSGASANGKEARVYKRHKHFASRDIRLRAKSKSLRKNSLGIETE